MKPVQLTISIIVLALIVNAAFFGTWAQVALAGLGVLVYVALQVLDRVLPERLPVPTGDEIMAEMDKHKADTKAEIERLQSVLNMATARPRMLRE